MAHILTDRVKETTTTTGTGNITLGGAVTGFQDFDSQMANADTTAYAIVHRTANEWEVGLGTWNTGNTLSRTTVVRSTNGNAAVNFSAGTKDVFMTFTPSVRVPGLAFTSAPVPATDDGAGLGSTALKWADLFLASGGQVNWNNGNMTLTHAAGRLAVSAGTFDVDDLEVSGDLFGNGAANPVSMPQGATAPFINNLATAATQPALFFLPGTLMTTPADGAVEMDATNFYGTTDAGNRGYIPVRHYIRANAQRNYTSDTSVQTIFNDPTNGRITLETGVYRFAGRFWWGAMSATSGNRSILFGGTATVGSWLWQAIGIDGGSGSAAARSGSYMVTNSSPASVVTASTSTSLFVEITGTCEVTGAGTFIPQTAMVTAAVSTLQVGSIFEIERIGPVDVVSVGQWD